MANDIRKWSCRNCGRSNQTEVALDGKVKCEYCNNVMSIQPSRARGGETGRQVPRQARTRLFSGTYPSS